MEILERIRNSKFEERYAKTDVTLPEAIQLLDYTARYSANFTYIFKTSKWGTNDQ